MMWQLYYLTILGLCSAATIEIRRTRQLDLNPVAQPQPQYSNFQQPGYLPPNEIAPAGAQNDVTILRPTEAPIGPTHHGRDLCTDPFHSFLCATLKPRRVFTGAKTNPIEGANSFNIPSKVLAPPLNDLEEIYTTTTASPLITTPRPTTTTPKPTTTTPRPTTTTPRPTTTRRPTTTTTTTVAPEIIAAPAASNDDRTYLPPENIAPAAASNDLAVVAPDNHDHDHDHHHHPHHHGRDLCTDPFHSFLCQPLKPRKRISGDLPNHLQGQSSFQSPQKVKPDPEVKPEPSNNVDLAYLPPSTTRRPVISTTIRTTPLVRISPQPSNDVNRLYLPPVTTTRRPPPPPPPTTTFQPQPSNLVQNSYLPPSLPQPTNINNNYLPPISTTRRPPPPPTTTRRPPPPPTTTRRPPPPPTTTFLPQPSNLVRNSYLPPSLPEPTNINNNYLPPDPKIEPAAAQNDLAIVPPDHDHHHHHDHHGSHGFKDICSDPFHAFLCTVPKPRTRITGAVPDHLRNLISPAPSNVQETRIKPAKPTTTTTTTTTEKIPVPQPDTLVPVKVKPGGYDYPKPDKQFPLPSENKPTKTGGYQYPKPDVRLTLPSEVKINVVSPTPSPTTSTTPRPRTITTPRPVTITTPNPTTRKTTNLQVSASSDVRGYDYPKPDVPFPPKKGYDYPKPEVKLTLPSEIKPVGYEYPKPSQPLPEPTKGYDYPKPSSRFALPSEQIKKSSVKSTQLPGSIKEARERLQGLQGGSVKKISNISNQNSVSDLITVNHVEFNGGFGERLQRRVRKHYSLVPPPGSHAL